MPGIQGYAVVIAQRVHISRVLSTAVTGFGSLTLHEFTVIGGNKDDAFRLVE